MSVRVEDEVIHLSGRCLAEDAEALLVALGDEPSRIVDIGAVQMLHMAVAQILLVLRPTVRGVPETRFLADHFVRLLQ